VCPRHSVFSIAVDAAGTQHRCCLRCLLKFGGEEQLERATSRSRYVRRVWECMVALEQLRAEFPDPARRPYGDKTLLRGIESPLMGGSDVERVTDKIRRRNWTEYDLARIEGRPEPPSKL